MPLCHYVDAGIYKWPFFLNPHDFCVPLVNRCPEGVLTAKILRRVETGGKIIKIANQCLPFLPTAKHSQDLRAHKIKIITTVKRTMTRDSALPCTNPKNRYIQQQRKDPGL